ncbi:MAG: NAD-dependent epimerase/dehydratase family protein [Bacteroidota bacterium]|nr:NAD-dependent epimerase/dehydratase family protein [Bacteroidota bacterium]
MNLVTGGTGLVGSHLILYLLKNNQPVRAIYRNEANIDKTKSLFDLYHCSELFDKIEWFKADICDVSSLEICFKDVDYVYHCAAMVDLSLSDQAFYKTNVEGTANMVNLAMAYGVKKFAYVSSIAALGTPLKGQNSIDENTEWNFNELHSDYALSKYMGEMEVFRAYQEGLDIVIVNPGVIFGAGFKNSGGGVFVNKMLNNFKFCTKGNVGVVMVEDVCRALYQLVNGDISGKKFILVGQNLPLEELLETIAKVFDRRPPTIYLSKTITHIFYKLDALITAITFKKRIFTKSMHNSAHTKYQYDNTLVRQLINMDFTTLEQHLIDNKKYYL